MIYFDNAATTYPKPSVVHDAIAEALDLFGNPSRAAHDFALTASRCVEETRRRAASLFHCISPERVAFTKNVTEALNIAITSVDGHIIATEAAHNSVLRPLYRRGNFSLAPLDADGRFDVGDIPSLCREDTAAVIVAHASNVTGNVAPVDKIGRFCRDRNILFIVDAAQTAGLLDINMEAACIDVLCFTGHKSLYGIQGTGGICVGPRFFPRPLIVGGSGSRTFDHEQPGMLPDLLEAGTPNSHGIAALGAGMKYVMELGTQVLLEQACHLSRNFVQGVQDIGGIIFYGDYRAALRMPVVTLNIGAMDSAEVAEELAAEYGIAVRSGAHCSPLIHKRFGTVEQGAVRFSFSHFNTEKEVAIAINALSEIAQRHNDATD